MSIWWDVRWKLNCSETLPILGMHGDHVVKVLKPVTVPCSTPPAGLSQGTAIQAPGGAGPSSCVPPHAQTTLQSPPLEEKQEEEWAT